MKLFSGMKLQQHDRWIPLSFIGFFVLLFALEANFIAIAYRSFTGLVTDEPMPPGCITMRSSPPARRNSASAGRSGPWPPPGPRWKAGWR